MIGTNKKDATETIELLLADARRVRSEAPAAGASRSCSTTRGIQFVEYEGWQAIDAAERAAGEPLGRPRVKLGTWEHLLATGGRIPPPSDAPGA